MVVIAIAIYRHFASSSADHQFERYCSVDGTQLRFEVGWPDSKFGSNIKVGVFGSVMGCEGSGLGRGESGRVESGRGWVGVGSGSGRGRQSLSGLFGQSGQSGQLGQPGILTSMLKFRDSFVKPFWYDDMMIC